MKRDAPYAEKGGNFSPTPEVTSFTRTSIVQPARRAHRSVQLKSLREIDKQVKLDAEIKMLGLKRQEVVESKQTSSVTAVKT